MLWVRVGWVLQSSMMCLVYRLAFFFPLIGVLRDNKPRVLVLQIITLSGFGFFIFHNFIHVVLPSFGWSSCSPLSLCRCDKPRIPLSSFSGPSGWALGGDPQDSFFCVSTIICDVVCQHVCVYCSALHAKLVRNDMDAKPKTTESRQDAA